MKKVRAFCIGGLLGGLPFNFSIGMRQLSDKLNTIPGVSSTYEQNSLFPLAVVWNLIQACMAAIKYREIVLIGHSYGADAASRIAGYLWKIGIKVSLLVVVDTVITQDSVPATGGDRVLYYQRVDPMGGGNPPFDKGPGETSVTKLSLNHVAMAQCVTMHDDVIKRVKAITLS